MPFWKRKTKEERYIARIEEDLAWHRAEHMKLVYQKALIESALEASASKQVHLSLCIGKLSANLPAPAAVSVQELVA